MRDASVMFERVFVCSRKLKEEKRPKKKASEWSEKGNVVKCVCGFGCVCVCSRGQGAKIRRGIVGEKQSSTEEI